MQLKNNKEFQAAKAMTIGLGSFKNERKKEIYGKGLNLNFISLGVLGEEKRR